jgi:DNA mismatch repair protein MutS
VIEVEVSSPALDLLKQIEVDNLTRQALEQLYELKAALNS